VKAFRTADRRADIGNLPPSAGSATGARFEPIRPFGTARVGSALPGVGGVVGISSRAEVNVQLQGKMMQLYSQEYHPIPVGLALPPLLVEVSSR
jgi:hypothetical protein